MAYHYDTTTIISEPIKNRTARVINKAHEHMYEFFTSRRLKPKYKVLDNEISNKLVAAMKKHDIAFQLVLPHLHQSNVAERSIQTWKKTLHVNPLRPRSCIPPPIVGQAH